MIATRSIVPASESGLQSLKLMVWGIYAVWSRHARVYQRTWLVNCLPPLLEPVIYLVAFGYGLAPLIQTIDYLGRPVPYLSYIAPAMIGVGLLFQSFFEGAYGSFNRLHYQKTWQSVLTTPVSFTEIFIGEWLWAASKGMIVGTVTGLMTVLLGLHSLPNLLLSVPFMLLGALVFGGIGILTASSIATVDQVSVVTFLVIVPMFTLCGTYFPRANLPVPLQMIAKFLPLSALVDLLRWHLGLPDGWWLGLIWLLILMAAVGYGSARMIHRQVIH
jgi:lipooligosaccharide transport system permease protein